MVIALLSDRPVQLVDLPDVPNSLAWERFRSRLLNQARKRTADTK